MELRASVLILSLMCVFMSGCATQGTNTFDYLPPIQATIKNENLVNKTYSQVWDGLVKEISKSFYVINNIDKESRIINLSFSTNTPTEFIDCGKTHRTYTRGDNVEIFDYEVAGPSMFKYAAETQTDPRFASYAVARRVTTLEGRSNIYIAPDDKDKNNTVITVADSSSKCNSQWWFGVTHLHPE